MPSPETHFQPRGPHSGPSPAMRWRPLTSSLLAVVSSSQKIIVTGPHGSRNLDSRICPSAHGRKSRTAHTKLQRPPCLSPRVASIRDSVLNHSQKQKAEEVLAALMTNMPTSSTALLSQHRPRVGTWQPSGPALPGLTLPPSKPQDSLPRR